MKRIILAIILLCTTIIGASSQEIFKEVRKIMRNAETIKDDTTKKLDVRKVATFKYDAIYYLMAKGSETKNFSEYDLGQQVNAMLEFVNIYIKRIAKISNQEEESIIMGLYKDATIRNPLFNDSEKEISHAYIGNNKFLTQFSLDTNWVRALREVKN